MNYDDRFSEKVSLSRVLDYFLEKEESPLVVSSFLEDHADDVDDIMECAALSGRMFSVDYVARMPRSIVSGKRIPLSNVDIIASDDVVRACGITGAEETCDVRCLSVGADARGKGDEQSTLRCVSVSWRRCG